ncbi:ribbon-helix-helix domain-containing protein [Dactylosporangium cerinum]
MISIRPPVAMVEELDGLADAQQARRSDVIREALAFYVRERTAPVGLTTPSRRLRYCGRSLPVGSAIRLGRRSRRDSGSDPFTRPVYASGDLGA